MAHNGFLRALCFLLSTTLPKTLQFYSDSLSPAYVTNKNGLMMSSTKGKTD